MFDFKIKCLLFDKKCNNLYVDKGEMYGKTDW